MKHNKGIRYSGPRITTPGVERAAVKAVQREADTMALFPKMRRFSSVEQRIAQQDESMLISISRLRALAAHHWREARRMLRSLPEDCRMRVMSRWQDDTYKAPRDAAYFADFVRQVALAACLGVGHEPNSPRLRECYELETEFAICGDPLPWDKTHDCTEMKCFVNHRHVMFRFSKPTTIKGKP